MPLSGECINTCITFDFNGSSEATANTMTVIYGEVLALRSFPRKYNAGNIFICPQNLGFFKKKRAAEPPWRNENRGRSHTLRFIC